MRVAIIGCGGIAQVHAWSLGKMEETEIVAFADIKRERAEEMSAKYTEGKAAVYSDYLEMMDAVRPDVVHICTPHYLHVPMAIEALQRNISVFMEKPPAISEEEFDRLNVAAFSSKGRIGFCFQNRYNETTKELDRIVREGELGGVIGARGFVTWRRDEGYYSDDWHGNLEKEGGGALINQSIHTLDLMLRYLGMPMKVEASMSNHHLKDVIQVEDTIEAWMEFWGGQRASFYATTAYAADAPVILELAFEEGRVTMIDQMITVHKQGEAVKTIICEPPKDGVGKSYWGRGHLVCIQDFYDCLRQGIPYENNLDGVANTLRTTMKIYDSARKAGN